VLRTHDRGYDNVLLGQGYRIPRGAVIDENGWSNDGMVIERGKPNNSERNLLHFHFVYHKSHLKSPGIDPGCPR
jgi:hypothetical protein